MAATAKAKRAAALRKMQEMAHTPEARKKAVATFKRNRALRLKAQARAATNGKGEATLVSAVGAGQDGTQTELKLLRQLLAHYMKVGGRS